MMSTKAHGLFLHVRNSFYILVLILLAVLSLIIPSADASSENTGSIVRVAARECTSASSAWVSPFNVAGLPDVSNEIVSYDDFTVENSASPVTNEYIQCSKFDFESRKIAQTAIGISFAYSPDVISLTPSAAEEPKLESEEFSQTIAREQTPVSSQLSETYDTTIGVLSVSNDGDDWRDIHTFDNEQSPGTVVVAVPDDFKVDTELFVRFLPTHASGSLFVDSIFSEVEIDEVDELAIKSVGDGDNTSQFTAEKTSVLLADSSVEIEVITKEYGNSVVEGVSGRLKDIVSNEEPGYVDLNVALAKDGEESPTESSVTWMGRQFNGNDLWLIEVETPQEFTPGEHTIEITAVDSEGHEQVITQNFLWGVLAFNTDQDSYAPGDTAAMEFSSLDENGGLLCDTDLVLDINSDNYHKTLKTSDGSIIVHEECSLKDYTEKPDYSAEWEVPEQEGEYTFTLTATTANGVYEIQDTIRVEADARYRVERHAPTRVLPTHNYPFSASFTARSSDPLTIRERIPKVFGIINARLVEGGLFVAEATIEESDLYKEIVVQDVELEKGKEYRLEYAVDFPNVSPEFWLVGPLVIGEQQNAYTFTEGRRWQIASDDITYSFTFDADNDADESAWTFNSPQGGGLQAAGGSNGFWVHDTNDTPSSGANIGPNSGQGGSPDGYVYTEASAPGAFNDVFTMTFDTILNAATDDWDIEFYWNQKGDNNTATVAVQTNENGAGWVTRGTYATGGPDVVSGGTQQWNQETLDLTGVISDASTQLRFEVTFPASGTSWHNDFGLDTITINGTTKPVPPSAPTLYDVPFDNERTADTDPSFEFTTDDPDGSANLTYQIQIDDDYAFGSPAIDCASSDACNLSSAFFNVDTPADVDPFNESERIRYTPSSTLAVGTYYWRVRALDTSGSGGSGTYGDWSDIHSVIIATGITPDEWYQTADEQFETATLIDTQTTGSDSVDIAGTGVTDTYTASGTTTWTVPDGVTSIDVKAWGAGGGGGGGGSNGTNGVGGAGAGGGYTASTLSVTPGEVLNIHVGGNGAGGVVRGTTTAAGDGGGGGGRSEIERDSSSTPLLVAAGGGGGGGGDNSAGGGSGPGAAGGVGGGATGGAGGTSGTAGGGSGGATVGAGGSGGAAGTGGATAGTAGALESGGDGGDNDTGTQGGAANGGTTAGGDGGAGSSAAFGGGGGGGSGRYGGGGAASSTAGEGGAGGGGGGSNYVTGTSTTDSQAVGVNPPNTGDGDYVSGVGVGGAGGPSCTDGTCAGIDGGDGLIVISYTPEPSIMSPEIDHDWVSQSAWDAVHFSTTETNGDVKVSVYYTVSTPCDTIVPDGALAGNSSGFDVSASPIDISGLTPVATTYNRICIEATLTDIGGSPTLDDWRVTWGGSPLNFSPDPPLLYDVPFDNERTADTTPDFEFQAEDPDGGADIIYQIQIDDTYDFSSLVVDCASDTSCTTGAGSFTNTINGGDTDPFNEAERMRFTPTTTLSSGTTYYWRVRAEDETISGGSGVYGDWSDIHSVTIQTGTSPNEWFQTTDEQFDTDTLTNAQSTGSDSAEYDGSASGMFSQNETFNSFIVDADCSTRPIYGNWTAQNGSDGTNGWTIDINSTTSTGTGPTAAQDNAYLYLETSAGTAGCNVGPAASSTQTIESQTLDASQYSYDFQFYWHMFGPAMVDASLHVDGWDGSAWTLVSTINTGNNGDTWVQSSVLDLDSYTNSDFKIRIRYVMGSGTVWQNDVAVDSLNITGDERTQGYVMSPEIDHDWVAQDAWDEVLFSTTETVGDVKVRLYHTVSTPCDTLIPDSALTGNAAGFDVTDSPIDISGLTPVATTYNRICLQAQLIDEGSGTPTLDDWTVTWGGVPVNLPPQNPTSLVQQQIDDTPIVTGGFTDETTVEFSAIISDQDASDTIQLCIEVDLLGTPFSNTEDSCTSLASYTGTGLLTVHSISGFVDGSQYHWQARVRDSVGNYSAWVSYGANAEAARDFAIDTTPPTVTVYDGTTEDVDIDFNNGVLNSLSANWDGNATPPGLSGYDYSIGTSPGATDVVGWTANGTSETITANSLTLNTSEIYYINVRITDTLGSQTIGSSDGQRVAPTLTFSTSPGNVTFDNLNSGNNYTSTRTTTLTTSTNAYNGYVIRAFATGLLTSGNSDTVGFFNGGTYATPDEWLGGDTGYGYTSNDTTIQGSNKFSPATCGGGGSPPCYAPFSSTAPGDIVADHTDLISGTPVADENFIITHRVTTPSTQEAGTYTSEITYVINALY